MSERELPDGQVIRYRYDTQGRVQSIGQVQRGGEERELLRISSLPAAGGASERIAGNGVRTRTEVDTESGRVTRLAMSGVEELDYRYDAAGRISDVDANFGASARRRAHYGYDALGRLNEAKTPLGTLLYAYDRNGNRTHAAYADQAVNYHYAKHSNRLTEADDAPYQYDQAGNPMRIGNRRYDYDASGRPISFFINGTLTARYTYNGWGERIQKVVYAPREQRVTHYLYEEHRLEAEADESGHITRQYLYLGDTPAVMLIGEAAYFIHTDSLGTPRALTDQDRRLVWRAEYAPFGEAAIDEDPLNRGQPFTMNLRFPGQYADQESGAYYNYFRDYEPQTGRYLQSDPIGLSGGVNTYVYTDNSPIALSDIYGLAVYLESHDIPPTSSWHAALLLIPDDQAAFANKAGFKLGGSGNGIANGKWYETISAFPSGGANIFSPGKLMGEFNRSTDTPGKNGEILNRKVTVSSGLWYSNACALNPPTDTQLINYLTLLAGSYKNDATYAYPSHFLSTGSLPANTYNSNSYISGILNIIHAGNALPSNQAFPGFTQPLPSNFFTAPVLQ